MVSEESYTLLQLVKENTIFFITKRRKKMKGDKGNLGIYKEKYCSLMKSRPPTQGETIFDTRYPNLYPLMNHTSFVIFPISLRDLGNLMLIAYTLACQLRPANKR